MRGGHTPGPWRHDESNNTVEATLSDGAVVEIALPNPYCEQAPEVERANARLLAAAPELLDALAAVFADNGKVNSLAWTDAAARALTKATGA